MVKLSTLMGAKYRLKQRRKRLTHRTGHEGAHDAFAHEWLCRARARNGAVPMKVRDAVDAARASKGPAELDLRGAATVTQNPLRQLKLRSVGNFFLLSFCSRDRFHHRLS